MKFALSALLVAGCATAADVRIEDDVEETVWVNNPKVLSCSPERLATRGKLILTLGPEHGKELAIWRESDKTWFFLVVQAPPTDMKPLMSREAFAVATRIEIPADSIGFAWAKDRGNERIFTSPGRYIVYASEVLESEVGGHECTVTFAGAPHAR
jgi:hypothetical protein